MEGFGHSGAPPLSMFLLELVKLYGVVKGNPVFPPRIITGVLLTDR